MIYQFDELEDSYPVPLRLLYFNEDHMQESLYRPFGTAYYQWIYCISGEGALILGDRSYPITQGIHCMIASGEGYSLIQKSKNWKVHILTFTGECCKEILSCLNLERSGAYVLEENGVWAELTRKIKQTKDIKRGARRDRLSVLCYGFLLSLATLARGLEGEQEDGDNPLVTQVISYLERNYDQPISLEDVALHLHMSKEYLCTQFKKYTDMSIFQYLKKIRIGKAKVLFRQCPYDSVADIAKRCGFDSPSYFGKVFREEMGVTPNTYRKLSN